MLSFTTPVYMYKLYLAGSSQPQYIPSSCIPFCVRLLCCTGILVCVCMGGHLKNHDHVSAYTSQLIKMIVNIAPVAQSNYSTFRKAILG